MSAYTARHTGDAHYRASAPRRDGIFEHGGFALSFFTRDVVDALAHHHPVRRAGARRLTDERNGVGMPATRHTGSGLGDAVVQAGEDLLEQ